MPRTEPPFTDRRDAGRRLAQDLAHLHGRHPVVLGLPRGGVPVAAEVAAALGGPLDVVVVRKLGLPWQPELAMGALGEDGAEVLDRGMIEQSGVTREQLEAIERNETVRLREQVASFRGGAEPVDIEGRDVVIVDDGVATGMTARMACAIARRRGAAYVVLAVPVAPAETVASLRAAPDAPLAEPAETVFARFDEVVCEETPVYFGAVGNHYGDFTQVDDEEVVRLLRG